MASSVMAREKAIPTRITQPNRLGTPVPSGEQEDPDRGQDDQEDDVDRAGRDCSPLDEVVVESPFGDEGEGQGEGHDLGADVQEAGARATGCPASGPYGSTTA